jgi:thioredoxin reductase
MNHSIVDIGIIGAGPTGLYAAYYAGFRGLSSAVVDALPEPGGQVAALYPEKALYDVAGHVAVKGRELIENLLTQTADFEPRYFLGQTATTLTPNGTAWTIRTDAGAVVTASAVVIAAGLGRVTPRTLPCAQPYVGRGVACHVPRLDEHRDRDVVIVGGGDSAVDWALALEPIARSVTLIHRRATLTAHEHSVRLLAGSSVRVITEAQVTACHGERHLERISVQPTQSTQDSFELPVRSLVTALGFHTRLGPIADWGVDLFSRQIQVDARMRTNLRGVHAAGDVCTYPGRVPLISVGFGEAATAVNHAAAELRPGSGFVPMHSTDLPSAVPAMRGGLSA